MFVCRGFRGRTWRLVAPSAGVRTTQLLSRSVGATGAPQKVSLLCGAGPIRVAAQALRANLRRIRNRSRAARSETLFRFIIFCRCYIFVLILIAALSLASSAVIHLKSGRGLRFELVLRAFLRLEGPSGWCDMPVRLANRTWGPAETDHALRSLAMALRMPVWASRVFKRPCFSIVLGTVPSSGE